MNRKYVLDNPNSDSRISLEIEKYEKFNFD